MEMKCEYYQKFDIPESIKNENLQKILKFYLLECPVPGVNSRGKDFEDYGFRGSAAFGKLKK